MGRMSESRTVTEGAAFEILSQCVAGRTHLIARTVDGIFNEELRAIGLRNTQLTIMAVLGHSGSLTVGELSNIMTMERSTLSRTLAKLRGNEWVAVAPGAGTQRWELTSAGKSKVRSALRLWRRAQARSAEVLGPDGVSGLTELGDRMMAAGPGSAE
jgi:DNA-binding MarR family transcriptional regulator